MSSFLISLEGKVAIVTGAGSGIGAQTAKALAAAGADVALVDRDAGGLATTLAAIEAIGGNALAIEADLLSAASPQRIVGGTLDTFGHLDILVNCAGIFEVKPFEESLESLDRQWAINVRAPFALTQQAMPYLRQAKGAVVFVSSVAGRVGVAGCAAYCASKAAVEGLVRALAIEEAPAGVRVNAIAPGNIRTSLNKHLLADQAYEKAMIDLAPLGRIGEVTDIAPAVVFLVSEAASYVTGTTSVIDGGLTAQ